MPLIPILPRPRTVKLRLRRWSRSRGNWGKPSQPDQVIGYFARATVEQANAAVQAATATFESWKRVPAEERAGYLFAAADLLKERRLYFNAWMIYEVGKSWAEADGDTAE